MITVTVNQDTKNISATASLDKLLEQLNISLVGIAVAVNNQIITKQNWANTSLHQNDNITIIKATQGG